MQKKCKSTKILALILVLAFLLMPEMAVAVDSNVGQPDNEQVDVQAGTDNFLIQNIEKPEFAPDDLFDENEAKRWDNAPIVDGLNSVNGNLVEPGNLPQSALAGVATWYETEPNNTQGTATLTYDDYDNFGKISTLSDIDWWKVGFSSAGNANFWLGNIPSGCDYDLEIYTMAGTKIAESKTPEMQMN